MNVGVFDNERREYVIRDPRTPVKWINYIGTLAFGGFVDHTGGALLCKGDPASNRILKYIPQLPDTDFKGATLYLRIRQAETFRIVSPFYVPGLEPLDRFECRVGLGYTRLVSEIHGLRTEATIFVPLGAAVELRDIRVTNLSNAAQTVDVIPVVEYSHPDALRQLTNADWVPQTMQSRALRQDGGHVVLLQHAFMYRHSRVNYLTSNLPVSSFDSDRGAFLGRDGTWARPAGLLQPELTDSEAHRGDNLGALLHPLGRLQPGESRRLITQLGQTADLEAALGTIETYRQEESVEGAFQELARFWDIVLERFQVHTPDSSLDTMVNIHNPRQCYVAKHWSRDLSLYQLGFGARGHGFRDSAQDCLGVLHAAPEEARDLLRQLLSTQTSQGWAMHQFHPASMTADAGDSRHVPGAPNYYSDDHLWIVLAVGAYIRETGDRAFLDGEIPFYSKEQGSAEEKAAVLEHLRRALAFTKGDVGAHGLPLLGFADWNDTVNLPRGAESVFSACLYARALLEMADLASFLGLEAEAARYAADHQVMCRRVNDSAWDGEWYVAYFGADGAPKGSHRNTHGQIYLHVQPWTVLAGVAGPERGRQAMEAVYRRLNTPHGIKLTAPGFDGYDPQVGGITSYPPGAKENGGIFLHANPWAMIAECHLGNGRRAYQYYRQINPALQNDRIEIYECEPYVYPQNILGDEHPQFGLARNSWLTGTASWAYQAATQSLLGLQPTHRGLRLDPCLPDTWPGFTASRVFRGARYEIEVENPNGVSRGITQLELDGRTVTGNVLPLPDGGAVYRVRAVM